MGHNESEHVVDSVNRVLDFVLKSMRASPTARVNFAFFFQTCYKIGQQINFDFIDLVQFVLEML